MIVLNKKRLVIITSCLLISIFAFMLSSSKKNDVIETVSLPVSGKTIVLDARTWNSRWLRWNVEVLEKFLMFY